MVVLLTECYLCEQQGERGREREREGEGGREREREYARACVCVRARAWVCVCVWYMWRRRLMRAVLWWRNLKERDH